MCTSRLYFLFDVKSQVSQLKAFGFLCFKCCTGFLSGLFSSMMNPWVFSISLGFGWHFFTWRCKLLLSVKSFSQYLHCFHGAPVCMFMCSFRYCLSANVFSQISHLCCSKFSSWHLITCVFKLSVLLKVLAHIWHVTTLSVWTFWCLAMCPFLNTFPHLSHFISDATCFCAGLTWIWIETFFHTLHMQSQTWCWPGEV